MEDTPTFFMADDAAKHTGNQRKSRRSKIQDRQRNRLFPNDQQYHYVEEEHRNGGKPRAATTVTLEDTYDGAGSLSYSASSCDSSSGDCHSLEIENIDIVDPSLKTLFVKDEVKGGLHRHIMNEKNMSSRDSRSTMHPGRSSAKFGSEDETPTRPTRSLVVESQERKLNNDNNNYLGSSRQQTPLKKLSQKLMNDSPRDIRHLRTHSPSTRSDSSINSSGNSTPTSPPPRSKKNPLEENNRRRRQRRSSSSHETSIQKELWYSKSWMCGFTDALNFSSR